MENDDEQVDEMFNQLLELGALQLISINDDGEPIYRVTEKCKDIFPELYYMHKEEVDEITFSLWQLGIVDISLGDAPANDSFSFNKNNLDTFFELEHTLTEEQIQVVDVFMSKEMREKARKLL